MSVELANYLLVLFFIAKLVHFSYFAIFFLTRRFIDYGLNNSVKNRKNCEKIFYNL